MVLVSLTSWGVGCGIVDGGGERLMPPAFTGRHHIGVASKAEMRLGRAQPGIKIVDIAEGQAMPLQWQMQIHHRENLGSDGVETVETLLNPALRPSRSSCVSRIDSLLHLIPVRLRVLSDNVVGIGRVDIGDLLNGANPLAGDEIVVD